MKHSKWLLANERLYTGNVILFCQSETSINLQVWLWVCQYLNHLRANFKTCGETQSKRKSFEYN